MTDKLTILKDLKSCLQIGLNGTVKNIILFGSQASDQAHEGSDYDILIVIDNDYDARVENKVYDLCYDIDLKYNIIIDAHLISTKELKTIRGKQPLFTKAIQTGLYA